MAGIDLGTSNSALAYLDRGKPEIAKPNPTDDVLPSVVFVSRRGARWVGAKAREAMLTLDETEGTGFTGWKTRMGQDDRYSFPAAQITMTAPELSAMVIGALLQAYREHTGQELDSCVVTVPAKFDQSAYLATGEAARLAGLTNFPLLQEPIAAALAYGFTVGDQRANWMVFDLGAGTLDVSLMAVREGKLIVLKEGQAGDPNLGGRNFDRELLQFVLGARSDDRAQHELFARLQSDYAPLRKQYRLDGFSEKTHPTAWGRLMLACETAKIELSRKERAVVELPEPLCKDDSGKEVFVEVPVTRAAYENLIAPDVVRAVHICQSLLSQNRMTGRDIDQLILIGGPTKTPCIQQRLAEQLGVELDVRLDPMLAVAIGAALHSETVESPDGKSQVPVQTVRGVTLELQHEKASAQPICPVAGVVTVAAGDVTSLSVEIRRQGWSSGQLPIDASGLFTCDVVLAETGRPHQSCFTTRVLTRQGKVVAVADGPRIWHPYPDVKATLANSLSVAAVGNSVVRLVRQGDPLPARASETVQTVKHIRRGSSEDVLKIPVIEAVTTLLGREDTDHADCNVHVGSLTVDGSDERMTSDLPAGSDVDITFQINQSREIQVFAYIPLLDEEFEASFTGEPYGLTLEGIETRFAHEKHRLQTARRLQQAAPNREVGQILDTIDRLGAVQAIETELRRANEGENTGLSRALKRVLELAGTLHEIWHKQRRTRLEDQLAQVRQSASAEELGDLEELEQAMQRLPPDSAPDELDKLEKELADLDLKIRHRPFYTLIIRTAALSGQRARTDQVKVGNAAIELASRLIDNGAPESLTTSDIDEIEAMNRRLEQSIPDLEERVRRFLENLPDGVSAQDAFGSTVRKR